MAEISGTVFSDGAFTATTEALISDANHKGPTKVYKFASMAGGDKSANISREDYKYAVIYAIVNTNPTAAIEGSLRAQALDAQSGSAMAIRGYRRSDETTASLQGDLVAEKDVLYVSAAGVVIGSTVDRLPALFQIVLATGTAGDVDVYVELHR